jgi:hypothetical protein
MNLGNHNETLLVSQRAPRRGRRLAAAVVLAAGLGTSAAGLADGTGSDRDAVEVAIPGNYGTGSGGGRG